MKTLMMLGNIFTKVQGTRFHHNLELWWNLVLFLISKNSHSPILLFGKHIKYVLQVLVINVETKAVEG